MELAKIDVLLVPTAAHHYTIAEVVAQEQAEGEVNCLCSRAISQSFAAGWNCLRSRALRQPLVQQQWFWFTLYSF